MTVKQSNKVILLGSRIDYLKEQLELWQKANGVRSIQLLDSTGYSWPCVEYIDFESIRRSVVETLKKRLKEAITEFEKL